MCPLQRNVPDSASRTAAGALTDLGSPGKAVTLLRLEGITASAVHRAAALAAVLAPFGTAEVLEDTASASVWSSVRDVERSPPTVSRGGWPFGESSVRRPPARQLASGSRGDTGGEVIYDWGGGLIWAALPPKPDAEAALVRQRVNGRRRPRHIDSRPPSRYGADVDVFHPQQGGLAAAG